MLIFRKGKTSGSSAPQFKLIYHQGYGIAQFGPDIPVTPSTLFYGGRYVVIMHIIARSEYFVEPCGHLRYNY
jgi:hypothetical protein